MAERRVENSAADSFDQDDAVIKAAVMDIPVPTDLPSRLKTALRSHYRLTAEPTQQVVPCTLADTLAPSTANPTTGHELARTSDLSGPPLSTSETKDAGDVGWMRRTFLVAALAAGVSGFAVLANRWTRPAEPAWLAQQCNAIMEKLESDNPADWKRVDHAPITIPTSVKSQLIRVAYVAERPLAAFNTKIDGVIYRLDAGDGRGIFLIKMQTLPPVRGMTSRFEILPTPSGGWSFATMTHGEDTFVLAAAGTEQQMFNYIRRLALT